VIIENKEHPTFILGDLYSEQQKDILCKMVVEPIKLETESSRDLLKYNISFFDLIEQKMNEREHTLSLPCYEKEITLNPVVCIQLYRVITAEAMQMALEISETNLHHARSILMGTIEFLTKENIEGDDLTPLLIQDLKKCLNNMRNRQNYLQIGRGDLFSLSFSHANQRSSVYTTSLQSDMIEKILDSEEYQNAASIASDALTTSNGLKPNNIGSLSLSTYYT